MIREISKITGIQYDENDVHNMQLLNRIVRKFPTSGLKLTPSLDNLAFVKYVKMAAKIVELEGDNPPPEIVITAEERFEDDERENISPSKGTRIKAPSASGIRYSYGPVWNASVMKASGVATHPGANRGKLEHQAMLYGIEYNESMSSVELCQLLAPLISGEGK